VQQSVRRTHHPNMRAVVRAAVATLLIGILQPSHSVQAQGYPAEQAADKMTAADGFQVELVAAEPKVRQPVAIEFDDRGRLWAIQYLQYPNPSGLKRVKVDRYSRTEYDRVPKPPPHGPKGGDRITILEDTDGDGRTDHSKDFVSGLNLASGLAFGHGGVFVLNVPYLLFYPDRDRDDVPDEDPRVLLTGFGMHDAHSVANSLTWGPDGWLYGCQGSTVTANIRGIEFQQGVWRYHPRTEEFELFCEGGGNSWGLDFDHHGNLIYSTNHGGFVGLHGVQGAYLVKSFGKHGALHNPYAFGYFDHMPHDGFHGGHVTVGGTIYYGTTFPERFRGKYIGGDLLGHAVYWHSLSRNGSTFRSAHGGDLLLANDTWFAPSDVTLGPDGAIYVTDWHDRRTAHPDPDADWDRTNGRIYRIQWGAAKAEPHVDLNSLSSEDLVDWLNHENDWYARRALRILGERQDVSLHRRLRNIALDDDNHHLALRALWALDATGGLDESLAHRLLEHADENVRAWTVRLLGDRRNVSPDTALALARRALNESSDRVRSQLACTAKRLPAEMAMVVIAEVLRRDENMADPYIPLLTWWALEQHALFNVDALVRTLTGPRMSSRPLVREVILERLMKRYAAAEELQTCARLLQSAGDDEQRRELLIALDDGLRLRNTVGTTGFRDGTLFDRFAAKKGGAVGRLNDEDSQPIPAELVVALKADSDSGATDPVLLRIAMRLNDGQVAERVLDAAVDSKADLKLRLSMLDILRELGDEHCAEPLLNIVGTGEPPAVQAAAIDVLARFDDPKIGARVLSAYEQMNPQLKPAARQMLLGRRTWAMTFLLQVDHGKISPKEVTIDELRRIALHNNDELNALVRKHWGTIKAGTPGERLAEMRRLNNDLRAGSGDIARGREHFKKHCATCHRLLDDGNKVGPDLTHANRKDREFLLASLVDPSAQIRKEFLSYIVQTTNGRVLTGLIAEQTPAEVTLLDAKNQRIRVPMDEVELLKESQVSLMPDDVLKPLSPQDLRDLFAFLEQSPAGGKKSD